MNSRFFEFSFRNTLNLDAYAAMGEAMALMPLKLEAAAYLQERAKFYAPVDTGFLRDHIVIDDSGSGTVRVVSEAPYSHFIEFGYYGARHKATGRFSPQEHWPVTASAPKLDHATGGNRLRPQYVFYKESTAPKWHPPRAFMRPALEDMIAAFPMLAQRWWDEVQSNPKDSELGVHASYNSGASFGGAGGGGVSALGIGLL